MKIVQVACANGTIIKNHQHIYQNPFQTRFQIDATSTLEVIIRKYRKWSKWSSNMEQEFINNDLQVDVEIWCDKGEARVSRTRLQLSGGV